MNKNKLKNLAPKIIFEDGYIIVIDKPADLVVNRAETVKGKTLQDWLEKKITVTQIDFSIKQAKEFISRTGLVHRLDKQTSGLMVIAKNPKAFENLQNQFKRRLVVKKYLALVHGRIYPKTGNINAPIKRNPFKRKRFGVFIEGRFSLTDYKVKAYYLDKFKQSYSLLEVSPKTGRTHQIRVHFAHLKHPLVSDDLYGGLKTLKKDRQWCPRLFLHAYYLEFFHPVDEKKVFFEIKLAKDLQTALNKLLKIDD